MEWLTLLLFAACPLMMLFCMKGMFSKKDTVKSHSVASQPSEIQSLQVKMADLMEQNHQLMKEVEGLKQTHRLNEESQVNSKNQATKNREIS